MSRSSPALNTHDRELTRLLAFCGGFMLVAAATYFIPGMELVQPWIAGERVPLVHLVLHDTRVVESYPGMLETRPADEAGGATLAPDAFDTGLVEGASPTGPVASADVEEDPAHEGLPEDSPAEEDADPDGTEAAEDNPPQPAVAEAVADEPTEDAVAIAIVAPIPPVDAPPVASPPEAQSVAVETDTRGAAAVSNRSSATANMARPGEGRLPDRSPAVGTPLEVPPGALDAWFTAMARAEAGVPGAVARALHWGDSTIAADGITKTVRSRLQGRFGDAGPGFLAIHVDPRWSMRPSVLRKHQGLVEDPHHHLRWSRQPLLRPRGHGQHHVDGRIEHPRRPKDRWRATSPGACRPVLPGPPRRRHGGGLGARPTPGQPVHCCRSHR